MPKFVHLIKEVTEKLNLVLLISVEASGRYIRIGVSTESIRYLKGTCWWLRGHRGKQLFFFFPKSELICF